MIYEDLEGKNVLVTGSSSGIGAATKSFGLCNHQNNKEISRKLIKLLKNERANIR